MAGRSKFFYSKGYIVTCKKFFNLVLPWFLRRKAFDSNENKESIFLIPRA